MAFTTGWTDEALRVYSELVQRVPLPQLVHEHEHLLRAAGLPARAVLAGLLLLPAQAVAHPLGNFTVNHHQGITVHPDRVTVRGGYRDDLLSEPLDVCSMRLRVGPGSSALVEAAPAGGSSLPGAATERFTSFAGARDLTPSVGVPVLGLLISTTSAVAGDVLLRWSGVVSGVLVALGRTWFGVVLVLGYGPGTAATPTAVGLLLVRLRDRLAAVERLRDRFTALPTITAAFVLVVGTGLVVRAATDL